MKSLFNVIRQRMFHISMVSALIITPSSTSAIYAGTGDAIFNGIPRYDEDGKIVFHNESAWKSKDCRYCCDDAGAYMEIPFHGTGIEVWGKSNDISSYARITVTNSKKQVILSTMVDFYSKVPHDGLIYVSPKMPSDDYIMRIEVTGIVQEWITKKGIRYGSNGFNVGINKLSAFEN